MSDICGVDGGGARGSGGRRVMEGVAWRGSW